jgi:uncharacterized protein (TIGR04255 family)
MAAQQHLSRAPIIEAIIDIRVKLLPTFEVKAMSDIELSKNYVSPPVAIRDFEGGIDTMDDNYQPFSRELESPGYAYASIDGKHRVQFRKDGFSFSQLQPYTHWENVKSEAQLLWNTYKEKTSPELITRVATRYRNVLALPLSERGLEDYFTALPTIPGGLPKQVNFFSTQIVIPFEDDITATVIQQLLPISTLNNVVNILLDIDVASQKGVQISNDIWTILDRLRNVKNIVFFEHITEKTVQYFI